MKKSFRDLTDVECELVGAIKQHQAAYFNSSIFFCIKNLENAQPSIKANGRYGNSGRTKEKSLKIGKSKNVETVVVGSSNGNVEISGKNAFIVGEENSNHHLEKNGISGNCH